MSEAMDAEFGTMAHWTADAAIALGPEFAVAAGCRGSGGPAALDPLLQRLQVAAGDRMLDVGAGVGGPAGHARETTGVRAVLLEPQLEACRAAKRLFALPAVCADATAVPFADASFDVVWSLGVLCTTDQQTRTLQEIRRVLVPGGRAGLLVYVAVDELPETPEGNDFPTGAELLGYVAAAGLDVTDERDVAPTEDESATWRSRIAAVDAELERQHAGDDAYELAEQQSATMGRLLAQGHLVGRVLTTVRGDDPDSDRSGN